MNEMILDDVVVPARKSLLSRPASFWEYEGGKHKEVRNFRATARTKPVGLRTLHGRVALSREVPHPKPQLQKLQLLKDDVVSAALEAGYKRKIFEWVKLSHGGEALKNFQRPSIEGTWLTADTVSFITSELRKASRAAGQHEAMHDAVAQSIRIVEEALHGLLHSIASAIADNSAAPTEYVLAQERLESSVAKAILFRAPVDLYQQVPFITSLYKDVLAAVASGTGPAGDFWALAIRDEKALVLTVDRSRVRLELPVIEQWTKAKAIRLSSPR